MNANMKRTLIAVAAASLFAASAWSQPSGMGPGMMGGSGMGPGMMGGYGSGGYGMGPGMMGGYGSGGYGMGPGMMGGHGSGYGCAGPNLSDEQRDKIADIQQELAQKRWGLMTSMHQQGYQLHEMYGAGKVDDAALRKAYQAMADAQKQMFETSLDARKRIDSVLTKEQRDQLRRRCGGWGMP